MFRTARLPRGALAACALAAALSLTGCAAGQISQTATQVAAEDGANGGVGNLGVRNAVLASPQQANGYLKGADAPLSMYITNAGIDSDTLSQVTTTAAGSVEITAGKATIPGQTSVSVGTGTPVKLTLKGLTADLPYGVSIPITFSFATAGSVTLNVPVAIPAERAGQSRPTVNIQPVEPTPLWETGAAEGGG